MHPSIPADTRNIGFITDGPAGIDDFLVNYTLQPRSICDFMSWVDEPDPECFVDGLDIDPRIMPADGHTHITSNVCPNPCITFSKVNGKTKAPVQDSVRGKPLKPKSSACCKRVKPTVANREERRRDQNREAQRRYREKRMFQVENPYPLWSAGLILGLYNPSSYHCTYDWACGRRFPPHQ
jgi:hypothetical protein